jgi:hypothetical protein
VAITSHFLKFQAQAAIDSKTLTVAISHANRNKPIKQAVCDRGYVGAKIVLGANIILPKKALKRDNRYQRDKKRKLSRPLKTTPNKPKPPIFPTT